jgi:parvulin-like peptidyl-prolyl isomerase
MRSFYITASLVLLASLSASADVLASVGDRELTWEAFVEMAGGPESVAGLGISSEEAAGEILESWIREQLILIAAEESGTSRQPEVQAMIQSAVDQIVLEAYITQVLDEVEVSRLEVENYVDVWAETYATEYSIRHMLFPDNSLASSILSRLNSGESFATLASSYSVGPSAASGGNLGWMSRGMASPSFMEAVCQLETGEISGVIETPMGYHIIQLMEKRPLSPAPSRNQIIELATMELISARQEILLVDMLDSLRAEHPVNAWPGRLLNHI